MRWQALRDRVGDIAISTIDAFCFSLLREFPLEAGLDPGFTLADETEVARLVEDALDRALRDAAIARATTSDVALVLAQMTLPRLRDGLAHLLERRFVAPAALRRYLRGAAGATSAAASAARARRGACATRCEAVPGGLAALLATARSSSELRRCSPPTSRAVATAASVDEPGGGARRARRRCAVLPDAGRHSRGSLSLGDRRSMPSPRRR